MPCFKASQNNKMFSEIADWFSQGLWTYLFRSCWFSEGLKMVLVLVGIIKQFWWWRRWRRRCFRVFLLLGEEEEEAVEKGANNKRCCWPLCEVGARHSACEPRTEWSWRTAVFVSSPCISVHVLASLLLLPQDGLQLSHWVPAPPRSPPPCVVPAKHARILHTPEAL
jgi:hypothetical protein